MHSFIGIIPARYASSRFPGKPLCDLCGKTMIKRVYESVIKWSHWKKVYVATDSLKIAEACERDGIPYIMTKDCHVDCLDRVAEVVNILEDRDEGADRYIVIQGDEPLFNVDTLNVDLSPELINFYTEVQDNQEIYNANAVKVVVSKGQRALYFSRYAVPYHDAKTMRKLVNIIVFKQIGVYVFSGKSIRKFANFEPSYLEVTEGIGLNRFLENDIKIEMRYTKYDSISVDTQDDRKRIIDLLHQRGEHG